MRIISPGPIIVIDTREQLPFDFQSIAPVPSVIKNTLRIGDYSLWNHETEITIERKSLPDLFQSFGKERDRFCRECQEMPKYRYAAVVIEADISTILDCPPPFTRMKPKVIINSMLSWSIKYGIHFWTCPGRIAAEKITYRLLEKYWKEAEADAARHR